MKAIFKREFKSYFTSAGGYIFIGIFLLVMGFYFIMNISASFNNNRFPTTVVSTLFQILPTLLAILIPLVTMSSFADEKKNKTDQLLLTSPNTIGSIVMGKFFGAYMFIAVCLATTLLQIAVFYLYGDPNLMMILVAYGGTLLMAAMYTAVGLFFSSLTEYSLIAAISGIVGFVAVFPLIAGRADAVAALPVLSYLLGIFDISKYYNMFYSELLSVEPIVYFVSMTVLFLFLTTRVIEARRWK